MTIARVVAYAPNGPSLGPLPTPSDVAVGYPLNDMGALTLSYATEAARSDLLGKPVELAIEVSYDQGQVWLEPPSSRFLYLRDGRDAVETADPLGVEAAAYLLRLRKALVGFAGINSEGVRPFTNATPGKILHDLFTAAQQRGALQGVTWSFTAVADSSGKAWPEAVAAVSYEPGADLLTVLTGLAEMALVDFRTQGRTVQVYVAESTTGMAQDRTIGADPVVLRRGRDLTEGPFKRTWEGLADTALVKGDNNSSREVTNAAATKPWGRQETYVTASGSSDQGTLQVIGDAALELTAAERTEHTFGLAFGTVEGAPLPFRDYGPGQWVSASVDGSLAPQRMRVRQVTLTLSDDGSVGGNVVLNDRFLEGDVLTARRLNRLTGGATSGGTGTTPTSGTVGNDILAPAKPTGLSVTSSSYVEADGRTRSQVTLDWNDVTTNADGTVTSDVVGYEVREAVGAIGSPEPTYWRVRATTESLWSNSPYDPGVVWRYQVRAIDGVYNRGAWSDVVSVEMARDTGGPSQPSEPTAASRLGVAQITWDGKTSAGGNMPADFREVRVHVSTGGQAFAPTAANEVGRLSGAGVVPVTGLTYGTTYHARLVAYDSSGNAGVASDVRAFGVASLADSTNFPDSAMQVLYARTAKFISVTADMVEAGEFKGLIYTGGMFRTSASGQRVQIDAMGLHGIDASGVEKTTVGSNGLLSAEDATLTGAFRAGSVATNITVGPTSGGIPGSGLPGYAVTRDGQFVHSMGAMSGELLKGGLYISKNHHEVLVGDYEAGQYKTYVSMHLSNTTAYGDSVRFRGVKNFSANMDGAIGLYAKGTFTSDSDAEARITGGGDGLQLWYTAGLFRLFSGSSPTSTTLEANLSGTVFMRRHPTGTAAANVIMQAGGQILRSTSRRDAKLDPVPIPLARLKGILAVPVVKWFDRQAAEDHAAYLDGDHTRENQQPLIRIPGMIAEDVEATGLTEFVTYDETTKRVEGLAYDRIGVAWVPLVKDLYAALEALARRVQTLEQTTVRVKV